MRDLGWGWRRTEREIDCMTWRWLCGDKGVTQCLEAGAKEEEKERKEEDEGKIEAQAEWRRSEDRGKGRRGQEEEEDRRTE